MAAGGFNCTALAKNEEKKKRTRLSASERKERERDVEKEVWMGEGNVVEYGNMEGKKGGE